MASVPTTRPSFRTHDAVDLAATTLYLCYTLETGLAPQFTHPEDWPIYGGVGCYVAFAAGWYRMDAVKPPI
jgi:hypothetical protein